MEDSTWVRVCGVLLFISFLLIPIGGIVIAFEFATADYILPRYGVGLIILSTIIATVSSSVSRYFKNKYAFDNRRITVAELRSNIKLDLLVWLFIGAVYLTLSFYLG